MKVLLLHPEDTPLEGQWKRDRWDLVIDLGWAGSYCYDEWSKALGCPVHGLYSLGEWMKDILAIREILTLGRGSLVDDAGIDWWDLIAPTRWQQLFEMRLVEKLSRELSTAAELSITRPHRLANALCKTLNTRPHCFLPRDSGLIPLRLARYARAVRTLTRPQVVEIALDKWDTDYGFRRFFSRKERTTSTTPRVLLPSAYKNVSRVLAAYASMVPAISFLLVVTREGCVIDGLTSNVQAVSLASYTPVPRSKATERQIASLADKWTELEGRIRRNDEFAAVYSIGLFENFQVELRHGLRVRDAWQSVLEQHCVSSVLCGDENNLYTRLPVLLAKQRGIHTVYCSHGALDVNVLIRGICSDRYLAKGEMERDYLIQQCGVPSQMVFVGAPVKLNPPTKMASPPEKSHIVFFSEAYELYSGRTENLYRELLPRLCSIARQHGRKVIVKLHPFESLKARRRLIDEAVESGDRDLVEATNEPVSDRLFQQTWFSLTVESTVAVECALAGVPAFLCGWFDLGLHNYVRQYEKYGVARILHSPEEVNHIPETLSSNTLATTIETGIYQAIEPERLESILRATEGRTLEVGMRSVSPTAALL